MSGQVRACGRIVSVPLRAGCRLSFAALQHIMQGEGLWDRACRKGEPDAPH